MDKLAIVIGNYIDRECDADTTPRQAYERGFRRATEKCDAVMRSRKAENDALKESLAEAEHSESMAWDRTRKAEAENAKLRERVSELEELTDHRHYMPQEWYATLQAENAKLKALVRDMWRDIPKTESCGWDSSANTCTGSDECHGECALWHRMRDLGIEMDDINQSNFKSTKNLVDLNEVREVDE